MKKEPRLWAGTGRQVWGTPEVSDIGRGIGKKGILWLVCRAEEGGRDAVRVRDRASWT